LVAGYPPDVWPPAVEAVAIAFRGAAIDARLEELAAGEESFPGPAVRVEAFDCDGRLVVLLVPADRRTAVWKLRCVVPARVATPPFPYTGATVLIDQSLFSERLVWIEAGSPRHAAAVSAAQLARIVQARPADLVVELERSEPETVDGQDGG
jgi:hypothetical protein